MANPDPPAAQGKQQVYRRTLEATREAIADVRDNMRAVRDARDRTQQRVEELQKELTKTKHVAMARASREERLDRALKRLRTDRFRCASELARVTEVNQQLEQQLQDLTGRCNSLAEKATDLQLVVRQKADLQRRLSETRTTAAAKDRMIADLEKHLRRARAVAVKARKSEERQAAQDTERTSTLQQQASELTKESVIMKKDAQELQGTAMDLRTRLTAERELRETLQFDLDLSRKTIRELKQTLGEVIESGQGTMHEFEEALGSQSHAESS